MTIELNKYNRDMHMHAQNSNIITCTSIYVLMYQTRTFHMNGILFLITNSMRAIFHLLNVSHNLTEQLKKAVIGNA